MKPLRPNFVFTFSRKNLHYICNLEPNNTHFVEVIALLPIVPESVDCVCLSQWELHHWVSITFIFQLLSYNDWAWLVCCSGTTAVHKPLRPLQESNLWPSSYRTICCREGCCVTGRVLAISGQNWGLAIRFLKRGFTKHFTRTIFNVVSLT